MSILRDKLFFLLLAILLVKAMFMAALIQFGGLDLAPDEAQYWTWSQNLDWGYYSKPPGIALEIWLGTKIFGDTVLGVRIGAVILSTFISLSVFALALVSGLKRKTAFWAAVISSLTPMGFFASFYATTDVGLVLFWTLAFIPLAKAAKNNQVPNYLLVGLLIALGALFKWPIYLVWACVLVGMILFPSYRNKSFFGGMLISLLGFIPPIMWNAPRGWPTFQHVWTTMNGGHGAKEGVSFLKGNFFDFFGAQAMLMSPILFVILIYAFFILFSRKSSVPAVMRFFGYVSLAILATYQVFSSFQKIQANWCVFVYPLATVFLSWTLFEYLSYPKKWLYSGLALSLVLVAIIFTLPAVQVNGLASSFPIPLKLNRLNECLGWSCITDEIKQAGYLPEKDFLFSDSYQITSLLSFYAPGKRRAYFLNFRNRRQNQFSYYPSLKDEQLGKSGFFAVLEEFPIKRRTQEEAIAQFKHFLKPYFKDVQFVKMAPLLHTYGKPRKVMLIYRCEEYNGNVPEKVNLF